MSQSLYRKYRPQTFADVVGQEHIVSTFTNAVENGKVSHAYLFTGPRGTGKTTMARLLAKALLCEQGPGHEPDGTCEQCRAVAAGVHPDVYELDAASRTGVDNVRDEIINKVSFAPTQGRYKIYIIDEVHMLTTAAFNALLKTLEEPPSHVVFVLCTTDPQKVPDTILSRCQRFDFHHFSVEDLQNRLRYVCEQEGFEYDEDALDLVARHSAGGMRDALSTLEQLSVFGDGKITLEDARSVLGEVESTTLHDIAKLVARRDVVGCFAWIAKFVERGTDLTRLIQDLTAYMRDVYVLTLVGDDPTAIGCDPADIKDLKEVSKLFGGPDRISRVLALLGELSSQMRTATDQRLCVEVAFTRMARPESELTLDALAERIERLELRQQLGAATAPAAAPAAPAPAAQPVQQTQAAPAQQTQAVPAAQTAPVQQPQPAAPARKPEPQPASQPAVASAPQPAPAPAPQPQQQTKPQAAAQPAQPATTGRGGGAQALLGMDRGALQRAWDATKNVVSRNKPARGVLLLNTFVSVTEDGILAIELSAGSDFSLMMLERADNKELVSNALEEVFGFKVPFSYCMGYACSADTPLSETSAPAEQPAPAAPAPEPAPQPKPQPQPQPAPQPAPAPKPEPVPAPQPAPAPAPTADDVPPYDDVVVDDNPTDYDPSMWEESTPAKAQEPAAAPAPAPAQKHEDQPEISEDIASILTAGFGDGWVVKEDNLEDN